MGTHVKTVCTKIKEFFRVICKGGDRINSNEKEALQAQLEAEKEVLKKLEAEYKAALAAINEKVKLFDYDIGQLDTALQTPGLDEKTIARLESMKRSKVYQKQHQEALKGQIGGIVDKLHGDTYSTISEYLNGCYTDGFLGTMYSLHQQGIPLIMPIDQAAVIKAVQLDSKISKGLYTRLGVDSAQLKKVITSEITRGVASSMPYADIARNIRNASSAPLSNCYRIAKTEGHRIQQASAADARNAAKKKGADVLKQWDATLDGRTRDTHRLLDGQIRETDELFEANGKKAMEPGSFGDPAEDCNCRCVALTRARWALDEDELKTLQDRAKFFGLDKAKSFDDFKDRYLKLPENADKINLGKVSPECQVLLDYLKNHNVTYNPVKMHEKPLPEEEIIRALAGGDLTRGSCASVGLAYCGQKGGMDVLDFRGGESLSFFSSKHSLMQISELPGVKSIKVTARSSVTCGNKLLKKVEAGKEYYLCCGKHASIVRRTEDGVLQYLELQSNLSSGWTNFNGNPRYTLATRFGEVKGYDITDFMIDVDSIKGSDNLRALLGYINTANDEQKKGKHGHIK